MGQSEDVSIWIADRLLKNLSLVPPSCVKDNSLLDTNIPLLLAFCMEKFPHETWFG